MTISLNKYRLVIFDLDGTLYPLTRRFKLLFALKNIASLSLFRAHLSHIDILRQTDFNNQESLLDAHFSALATKTNKTILEVKEWYFNRFYPTFIQAIKWSATPRPHLTEIFEQLKKRNIKTALFSDYSHIKERLAALNIKDDIFDILLSGEEEGALKPSPRPIEILKERFNLSEAEMVIIGDRQESDGKVAQRSGIDSIIIGETTDTGERLSWSAFVSLILEGERSA
ncbi:HAD family hydrolase [bacterium]|nr:HAD family hydrolase [bacterium]